MTDRKVTCAACKSAVTKGDIAGSDLEFGGELKATNQPEYTADADTDLVATVGTLDEYTPMVRTTGNQTIGGDKTFTGAFIKSGVNYTNITIINTTDDNTDNTKTDRHAYLIFADANNVPIARIGYTHSGTSRDIKLRFYKADGTAFPDIVLGQVTE